MTLTQADGATTIDPDWPGPFFETPTSLPPEASRSSHSRRFAAHARRRDLRICARTRIVARTTRAKSRAWAPVMRGSGQILFYRTVGLIMSAASGAADR